VKEKRAERNLQKNKKSFLSQELQGYLSNKNKMIDIKWLSGFFDGEGSIWINRHSYNNSSSLRISISQADSRSLEEIKKDFGGKIDYWISKVNNKKVCHWVIQNGSVAEKFLIKLLPHLREKKIQAELALSFMKLPWRQVGKGGKRWKINNEQVEIDEMFAYSIKIAKPRYWEDYDKIKSNDQLLDYVFEKVCEKYV